MRKLYTLLVMLAVALGAAAQLPSVTVKDLEGRSVDTATLSNDGKPFTISFFATWCKPCLRELKAIAEVYPDWQDETGMKMYIVSIDTSQNASKVKPLVDAEGWEYETLLDSNSDFFRALGIQSVPHMLVLDGKGNIVESHSGYTDGAEDEVIKKIRSLSQE
ncbi:MAG: TlpA family protein disulfide reductase [Duncaniella sp.]|nr:TlpA family protein disulfide reductase [Duncaniella sp.]